MLNKQFVVMMLCLLVQPLQAQVEQDPTRPGSRAVNPVAGATVLSEPVWSVQAVMISSQSRRAIINGQLVQEGALLSNDVRVERIRQNQVVLARQTDGVWQREEVAVNDTPQIKVLVRDKY